MKRDSVDILIAVHSKDSIGRDITTWSINRTITGSFQPAKYSTYFKPYGITDKTSNVLYCEEDTNITADMRIGFNSKQYRITSILSYKKHMEIYLELVI